MDYKKIESHNQNYKSVKISQNNLDNWKPWIEKTSIQQQKVKL